MNTDCASKVPQNNTQRGGWEVESSACQTKFSVLSVDSISRLPKDPPGALHQGCPTPLLPSTILQAFTSVLAKHTSARDLVDLPISSNEVKTLQDR